MHSFSADRSHISYRSNYYSCTSGWHETFAITSESRFIIAELFNTFDGKSLRDSGERWIKLCNGLGGRGFKLIMEVLVSVFIHLFSLLSK